MQHHLLPGHWEWGLVEDNLENRQCPPESPGEKVGEKKYDSCLLLEEVFAVTESSWQ